MSTKEKTKKSFQMPHQLIIIVMIVLLAMVCTWVIPAGEYGTIEINGRNAIDASSFTYVDQKPVGIWDTLLALPQGYIKQIKIITMVMMIAGAMGVINATKAFDASSASWPLSTETT